MKDMEMVKAVYEYNSEVYQSQDLYSYNAESDEWDEQGCEICCKQIEAEICDAADEKDISDLHLEEIINDQYQVRELMLDEMEEWDEDEENE